MSADLIPETMGATDVVARVLDAGCALRWTGGAEFAVDIVVYPCDSADLTPAILAHVDAEPHAEDRFLVTWQRRKSFDRVRGRYTGTAIDAAALFCAWCATPCTEPRRP